MRRSTFTLLFTSGLTGALALGVACSSNGGGGTNTSITLGGTADGDDDDDDTTDEDDGNDDAPCPPGGCLDLEETTGPGSGCGTGDGECNQVDLLFVIDNSGTMGEEQVNLSANFPLLIDRLQQLTNDEGELLHPDVNIMVTTTDLGHPTCTDFEPDGYEPKRGAPQDVACINRLDDFTGLEDVNPPMFPEACENGCPLPVEPADPFIHFEGIDGAITNVPENDVKGALSCIGPQGINGCGFEAPLEAMMQAINPTAEWNQGATPFLRDGAILAIAIITDESDCSVRAPEGYAYFTDESDPELSQYWEVNPQTGNIGLIPTSAVCINAGVDCGVPDANGVYADCMSADNGVLHSIDRYLGYLKDELIEEENKEVIMLGVLGVPVVTANADEPPFEPIAGGVDDLVYRQWRDGAYPAGDILPGDTQSAADKEYLFGIGPGCTGEDGQGGFTGQATPPIRIKEVCEALNDEENDRIRCCIESVCDTDFSDAMACLTGIIQEVVAPIG